MNEMEQLLGQLDLAKTAISSLVWLRPGPVLLSGLRVALRFRGIDPDGEVAIGDDDPPGSRVLSSGSLVLAEAIRTLIQESVIVREELRAPARILNDSDLSPLVCDLRYTAVRYARGSRHPIFDDFPAEEAGR